jgi:plasmid stabilization system protein ParE
MKQSGVRFTPRAERQLAQLYRAIADDGGEARADH